MEISGKPNLTYKDAGVDIDAGEALVERIRGPVRETQRPEVMGGLGGFGGLFAVPEGYRNPVLVAATDGVGTKLKLAIEHDRHDDVGIDLVAMCVNDLLVQGAQPLFFLDYFSTRELNVDIAERVIRGIARGCILSGATLLGGETAEHPGMGAAAEYDLAGFCVGVVERELIIDGSGISPGDTVIGLASSGPHSNGFSLIRRALERDPDALHRPLGDSSLLDALMQPTRIYARSLAALFARRPPRGLAHITGGGLLENIPRILPAGLGVTLDAASWDEPEIFSWLRQSGVGQREMYRTFNCGVGMTLVVAPEAAAETLEILAAQGEQAWIIGSVNQAEQERVIIR